MTTKGIIYFIQPAELVGTNRYKIGCSKNINLDRCKNGYKKGSRFICIMECNNPIELERKIKNNFNNKFELFCGNEYFCGVEENMLKEFIEITILHESIKMSQLSNKVEQNKYNIVNNENHISTLKKSFNGNTYNLAKIVYSKYSDRFVCSSLESNIWWEFKNHNWYCDNAEYTLKILLYEDFANDYKRESTELSIKATKSYGFEKEELQNKKSKIDNIVEKLMNNRFRNTLMDECKHLFYDPHFEQKVDSNVKLIGI